MGRTSDQKLLERAEEDLKEVLIELRQRQEANPLAFSIPNGKQEEFLKLPNFVNVISAGNGVGKTIILVNIAGNLIFGPQNEWFDIPRYRDFRRPSSGRIVSTHKNIKESIIPKLHEYFPKGTYITRKEKTEYEAKWIINNGCDFDIMTYDTESEIFEGPTKHWFGFDEPPPLKIFGACISRMREGGVIFIGMTPLYSGGWIFDRINNPWQNQRGKKWFLVMAEIEDNCIEHGVRGTLKHEDIEQMIAEYPAEEREARIYGIPIFLSGRVYKTFDPTVHVIPRYKASKEGYIVHALDPHDNKPFVMGWYLVDPTGDVYVIEEWPNEPYHEMKTSRLQIEDYGKIIEEKEADFKLPVETRIIDARYGNRKSVITGTTIRDEFDDYKSDKFPNGIIFSNSYTDNDASILAGHQIVKKYLGFDTTQELSNTNKPKHYVCDNCQNHIYGFLHYAYKDEKDPEKPMSEKVVRKHKDFMDLDRYALVEIDETIPVKEQNKKKEEEDIPKSWKKFREVEKVGYGG